jgi:hypothetical protein
LREQPGSLQKVSGQKKAQATSATSDSDNSSAMFIAIFFAFFIVCGAPRRCPYAMVP